MSADIESRLECAVRQLRVRGDAADRVGIVQLVVNLAQELLRGEVRRAKVDGGWAAEGFTSISSWLTCHGGLSSGHARAVVRRSIELQHMPSSMAAAERGELCEERVRLLVGCRRADPERYDAATDRVFSSLPIAELAAAAQAWKAAAADRRHDPTNPGRPPERSVVHLSQLLDGRWRLDGTLDQHDGALLNQALDQSIGRQVQARRDGDPSVQQASIGQLRATGLVDLAAQAFRDRPGERSRSGRYRVNLVVRPAPGGDAVVPEGPFPPEACCDAAWVRVVMGAEREILDVGRATRQWPEAIWRAIVQRDRACRFPYCDRPAHWCDVHHCTHWEAGGTTSVTNGLLLCRRHHVFLHTHQWSVQLDHHQHPVFRQPDGTIFQPRSSAPGAARHAARHPRGAHPTVRTS